MGHRMHERGVSHTEDRYDPDFDPFSRDHHQVALIQCMNQIQIQKIERFNVFQYFQIQK